MATKTKSNLINIAPFVDVLLVLFVILVVAARFDGSGKDKKVIVMPTVLKQERKDLESASKIDALQKQISELKDKLDREKKLVTKLNKDSDEVSANIIFGGDDKITVNGVLVNEDFVYTLLKSTQLPIEIKWKGQGQENADRLWDFAKTLGYAYDEKGD